MANGRRRFRRRRRYMYPVQYPIILIQQPEPTQPVGLGGSGLILGLLLGLLVLATIKK